MVIKINYNYVAATLSLIVVVGFILVEMAMPHTARADVKLKDDDSVKLPVAMYHHILESPSRLGDYVISPAQFEEDLKYIKKMGYTTITSKQLLAFLEKGEKLPENPIMITFDDGYESVYAYAYPLLKRYEMTAMVSIIGKHTDLFSDEKQPRHINYSHLSWKQLKEMQKSGIFEIQNHTYDMHNPPQSSRYGIRIKKHESKEDYEAALIDDISGLNEKITNEIGVTPTVFALPFGAQCKECMPILEGMGFRIILTCEEKVNSIKSNTEMPIKLRRFNRASKYSTYTYYSKLMKK